MQHVKSQPDFQQRIGYAIFHNLTVLVFVLALSNTLATRGTAAGAAPFTSQNVPVIRNLISQVRQYAHIKTIHFQAVGHYEMRFQNGKTLAFTNTYTYWGEGTEFRIDFQQFTPEGEFDVLVTDNGRHYRRFNRIADQLFVLPPHPVHGEGPYIRCPILEPLAFLAPLHARWHWLSLARVAGNLKSVLDRCREARNCAHRGAGGTLTGCISGSLYGRSVRVVFTMRGSKETHPMVTGWVASGGRKGTEHRVRLSGVRYRAFRLKSGRTIDLPIAFLEHANRRTSAAVIRVVIRHIVLDQPISPGKFTINYKLAKVVVDETRPGKWKYITIQPTHPATGSTRNLK